MKNKKLYQLNIMDQSDQKKKKKNLVSPVILQLKSLQLRILT